VDLSSNYITSLKGLEGHTYLVDINVEENKVKWLIFLSFICMYVCSQGGYWVFDVLSQCVFVCAFSVRSIFFYINHSLKEII